MQNSGEEAMASSSSMKGIDLLVAERDFKPGEVVLIDPGLVCFPSNLENTLESSKLIQSRVDALMPEDRKEFFRLPNFLSSSYDDYYGRYHTWAVQIRFSKQHAAIFPLLCLVCHSCAANCVTCVISDKENGNKKGWSLALHAIVGIKKGERITRFWLPGGGVWQERQDFHMKRFGWPCRCCVCNLPREEQRGSDLNRRVIENGYKSIFEPQEPMNLIEQIRTLCVMLDLASIELIEDDSIAILLHHALMILAELDDAPRAIVLVDKLLGFERILFATTEEYSKACPLGQFYGELKRNKALLSVILSISYKNTQFNDVWLWHKSGHNKRLPDAEDVRFPRASFNDLRNGRFFPCIMDLPHKSSVETNSIYYDASGEPKMHWFLLVDLVAADPERSTVTARDRKGRRIPIRFFLDGYQSINAHALSFGPIKVSAIIAYPAIARVRGNSGSRAVEVHDCHIKILVHKSLDDILHLSDRVQKYCTRKDGAMLCHGCDKTLDISLKNPMTCSKCQTFAYCSKACQKTGWKNKGHKTDCYMLNIDSFFHLFHSDLSTVKERPGKEKLTHFTPFIETVCPGAEPKVEYEMEEPLQAVLDRCFNAESAGE